MEKCIKYTVSHSAYQRHSVELVYMKYCNWLDPESYSEWSLPCLLSKRTVRQRTPEKTRGKENEALSPFMSKSQGAMPWGSAQESAHTEPVY